MTSSDNTLCISRTQENTPENHSAGNRSEFFKIINDIQRRIGQDLHDGVEQEIVGLGLISEALLKKLMCENGSASEESIRFYREMAKTLLEGIAHPRRATVHLKGARSDKWFPHEPYRSAREPRQSYRPDSRNHMLILLRRCPPIGSNSHRVAALSNRSGIGLQCDQAFGGKSYSHCNRSVRWRNQAEDSRQWERIS